MEQGPLRGGGHRHRPPGEATQMGRKHDTLVQAILASGTLKSTQMNVRINQLKLLAALQGRGGTRMRQEGNFRQNRTSGHVDTLSLVLYTLQAVAATMFSIIVLVPASKLATSKTPIPDDGLVGSDGRSVQLDGLGTAVQSHEALGDTAALPISPSSLNLQEVMKSTGKTVSTRDGSDGLKQPPSSSIRHYIHLSTGCRKRNT